MPHVRDQVAPQQLDVRADLERVEATLRETIRSDQSKVDEAARYLVDAGGKRFRPMLTLVAGHAGDPKDERLVPCAAAIELTHLATLYHDDVIDETTVRRGVPTANVRYGNSVAVLTGDFLLARASGLAADLGGYVSRRLADTIAELCEGQIMESELAGALEAEPKRYLEVIRRKTASLIATSCHLGAWLARASEPVVAALTEYGEALGMAFQLTDDILDVVGYEAATGKQPGTDIAAGVYTLPVLETLRGTVDGAGDLAAALKERDVARALTILRGNGSIDVAKAAAHDWAARAGEALGAVSDGAARQALASLAASMAERDA
jgi:heptaprenyl diphosphate synthase